MIAGSRRGKTTTGFGERRRSPDPALRFLSVLPLAVRAEPSDGEPSVFDLTPLPVRAPLPYLGTRELRRMHVVGSARRRCTVTHTDLARFDVSLVVSETRPIVQRLGLDDWANLISDPGQAISLAAWRASPEELGAAYRATVFDGAAQRDAIQLPMTATGLVSRLRSMLRDFETQPIKPTVSVATSWVAWPGAEQSSTSEVAGTLHTLSWQGSLEDAGPTELARHLGHWQESILMSSVVRRRTKRHEADFRDLLQVEAP